MKWFKHYSNLRQQDSLVYLMQKFGTHTGYACYFLLLEYCAERMDDDEVVSIHQKTLRQLLCLSQANIDEFLHLCSKLEILSYEKKNQTYLVNWHAKGPLVDEYNRKKKNSLSKMSGHSPDIVPARLDKSKEEEIRKDLMKIIDELITHWNSFENLNKEIMSENQEKSYLDSFFFKKEFSLEKIKQGISNYARIINSPDYYYNHVWDLKSFLRSHNSLKFLEPHFNADSYKKFSLVTTNRPIAKDFINPFLQRERA